MLAVGFALCIFVNIILIFVVIILCSRVFILEESFEAFSRGIRRLRRFQYELNQQVSSLYLDCSAHTSNIYHLIRRVDKLEAKNVKKRE